MSLIYLIRHGQTDWNKERIFRGHADRPLSDEGKKEAQAVAGFLEKEPIQFIYSSPLKRALETARPLAEAKGLKVVELKGVIDLDFGEWSGMTVEQVKDKFPESFADFMNDPQSVVFPGGETMSEVQSRALEAIEKVADRHTGETGAVVTHRVICKLVILGLLGLDAARFWEISQDTACINLFEYKRDRAVIHYVNESCHIRNLKGHSSLDF